MPHNSNGVVWEEKPWTEKDLEQLDWLWVFGEGGKQLSANEIAERMKRTKNSVVGKVHRRALPARPSPIRKGEAWFKPDRPRIAKVTAPTLPPLPSLASGVSAAPILEKPTPKPKPAKQFRAKAAFVAPVVVPKPIEIVAPVPPAQTVAVPFVYKRVIECLFPLGEPGQPGYHECGKPSLGAKSYCEEHYKVAFIKLRDRREDDVNYSIRRYG